MIPQYLVDFDLQGLPVIKTDCIVIGSGIAGLFTAIKASEDRKVIMITKKTVMESNTRYAQGGLPLCSQTMILRYIIVRIP